MLTFNTDGMVQQKFPFPAPIMNYIFKNLTASQLLKLYKTCKFFYNKFQLNIIEDFEIRGCNTYQRIIGNSMGIWHENPAWLKLNNLWITKSFTVLDNVEIDYAKFSRLTFDKLEFLYDTPVKDFDFLVNNTPTLRHLIIHQSIYNPATDDDVNVNDDDNDDDNDNDDDDDDDDPGNKLSVEGIIERAPQVSSFDFRDNSGRKHIDIAKLISLERQTKLTTLHFLGLYFYIPDPLLFLELFKKHAVPEIDFYMSLCDYDNPANIDTFYNTINDGLRAWKYSLQLPPTVSSSFIDLTGKTALITGAAEGIGKATVILFRKLGASVVAFGRQPFLLKTLTEECQNIKNDGYINTASIDPNDRTYMEDIYNRIYDKVGTKFDILVMNVDTSRWLSVPIVKLEEKYHDFFNILKGRFNIMEASSEYLIKSKGTIIKVLSSHGVKKPEDAASIANGERRIKIEELKLSSSGVRINSVDPGDPPTALSRSGGMNDISYQKLLQESKKSYEKEVANAIAFLASDAAKLIDGSTLNVNALNVR